MTLYEQFLKLIQSKQDKKVIIDNMLQGQKYVIFIVTPNPTYPDLLTIQKFTNVRTLPTFDYNEFYLPHLKGLENSVESRFISYLNKYLELSLCQPYENSSYQIKINIPLALENFKNNQLPFDSHSISFYNTPKKQKIFQTYYDICNYMKETVEVPEKQKHAFVLNFDFQTSRFNLRIVDQFNFHNFEYLFFLEDEKLLQEKSNLCFNSKNAALIDLEMTIQKIELFNSMKNF